MTHPRCGLCGSILTEETISLKSGVCISCRGALPTLENDAPAKTERRGPKPKRGRPPKTASDRCETCGARIRKTTRSDNPRICIVCYGEATRKAKHAARREKAARPVPERAGVTPVKTYTGADEDFFPEVDGLGGFSWADSRFYPFS